MSIERSQKISQVLFTRLHAETPKRSDRGENTTAASKTHTGTRVSLSNRLQSLQTSSSSDMNIPHLDKIKAALADGKLPIDTDKIAHVLTKEMFQIS